jgi:hypothetical protein
MDENDIQVNIIDGVLTPEEAQELTLEYLADGVQAYAAATGLDWEEAFDEMGIGDTGLTINVAVFPDGSEEIVFEFDDDAPVTDDDEVLIRLKRYPAEQEDQDEAGNLPEN